MEVKTEVPEESEDLLEVAMLEQGRERAAELIHKRCFIGQGFRFGEYCKVTEYKVHKHGFMHCYYTLMGTNKPLELYGYGEISNEMLYVNSFYAIGGDTRYFTNTPKYYFFLIIF